MSMLIIQKRPTMMRKDEAETVGIRMAADMATPFCEHGRRDVSAPPVNSVCAGELGAGG